MGRPLKWFQVEDGLTISKLNGALVAHEPRVGKTNIAIRAADLVGAKVVVVVCPAAVKDNWYEAIREFREGTWTAIIVSYNKVGNVLKVLRSSQVRIDVLICDESHYLKEKSTGRTRAVFGANCDRLGGLAEISDRIYCLTGTPMPNNPTELWPMLRAIAPHLIDNGRGKPMSWSSFRQRYCRMINTPYGVKIAGGKNYAELKAKLKTFVLRRTRVEVFGRDLMPPTSVYVSPKNADKKQIEALMNTEQGKLVAAALQSSNPLKALAKMEKQASSLRKLFGLAKVPGVVDLVTEELNADLKAKIVLFGYHHDVIDALRTNLTKFGAQSFDGRTTDARKLRIKKQFQTDPAMRVVVGQLDAMGVGLDFSAANDVMFVEQSWVGSNNAQAMSRIFNMNSPEPKFTRFVILRGSIDEQIAAACERKLADERRVFN